MMSPSNTELLFGLQRDRSVSLQNLSPAKTNSHNFSSPVNFHNNNQMEDEDFVRSNYTSKYAKMIEDTLNEETETAEEVIKSIPLSYDELYLEKEGQLE